MLEDLLPGPVRVEGESEARHKASSQKRAGLGVWACSRHSEDRQRVIDWKRGGPARETCEPFGLAVAELVRHWCPCFTANVFLTTPPQGASAPGVYAAEILARDVASRLDVPFLPTLARTDRKRWHGPLHALTQSPFVVDRQPPPDYTLAVVIDDLITSGATMRLSLAALHDAGFMAFGFSYSGC